MRSLGLCLRLWPGGHQAGIEPPGLPRRGLGPEAGRDLLHESSDRPDEVCGGLDGDVHGRCPGILGPSHQAT